MELITFEKCGIEIIGGQIMTRVATKMPGSEPVVETRKVIIPKAIHPDGTIDPNELAEENLKVAPDNKKVAHSGDIILKLSTPYDAGIVDKYSDGAIVPSFCSIVKCPETIEKQYLVAFLNSEFCKNQFKAQITGVGMSVLSVGKVRAVKMPVPDTAKQIEIGESFVKMQKKLTIIRRIAELEAKKNDAIFNEMVKK